MDELDPNLDGEREDDDEVISNKENPDEDSLDALAEEDDKILPEDGFDDVEPEERW